MLRTRRSAQVLALAVLTWIVGTVVLYAWMLVYMATEPDEHLAGDMLMGVIFFSPLILLAILGAGVIAALARGASAAAPLGLIWALLQVVFSLLLSWRLVDLLLQTATGAETIAYDAAAGALIFSRGEGGDWIYASDVGGVLMVVVAVIGLAASIVLLLRPEPSAARPSTHGLPGAIGRGA